MWVSHYPEGWPATVRCTPQSEIFLNGRPPPSAALAPLMRPALQGYALDCGVLFAMSSQEFNECGISNIQSVVDCLVNAREASSQEIHWVGSTLQTGTGTNPTRYACQTAGLFGNQSIIQGRRVV